MKEYRGLSLGVRMSVFGAILLTPVLAFVILIELLAKDL